MSSQNQLSTKDSTHLLNSFNDKNTTTSTETVVHLQLSHCTRPVVKIFDGQNVDLPWTRKGSFGHSSLKPILSMHFEVESGPLGWWALATGLHCEWITILPNLHISIFISLQTQTKNYEKIQKAAFSPKAHSF